MVRCAALCGACNMGTLVGMTIFVPLYFEVVLHMSASQSGLALIPLMGATVGFSTITGRMMMHVAQYKRVPLTGIAVAILSLGVMAIWPASMSVVVVAAVADDHWRRPWYAVSDFDGVPAERVARTQMGIATGAANFFRALFSALVWRCSALSCWAGSAASLACRWKCWRAPQRDRSWPMRFALCFWPARWCWLSACPS
ncbi:MAG: hypothetical protein WDN48_04990 [Pseudolabrys sp.]